MDVKSWQASDQVGNKIIRSFDCRRIANGLAWLKKKLQATVLSREIHKIAMGQL